METDSGMAFLFFGCQLRPPLQRIMPSNRQNRWICRGSWRSCADTHKSCAGRWCGRDEDTRLSSSCQPMRAVVRGARPFDRNAPHNIGMQLVVDNAELGNAVKRDASRIYWGCAFKASGRDRWWLLLPPVVLVQRGGRS